MTYCIDTSLLIFAIFCVIFGTIVVVVCVIFVSIALSIRVALGRHAACYELRRHLTIPGIERVQFAQGGYALGRVFLAYGVPPRARPKVTGSLVAAHSFGIQVYIFLRQGEEQRPRQHESECSNMDLVDVDIKRGHQDVTVHLFSPLWNGWLTRM